jgi:type II secretory pathway pseudopilin PulG
MRDERGYLMVALLVAMSVMGILMGAALPAWRTWAQREREAELIFRGEQYARAIALFQQRYANASPPDIDTLVNQKFLRKKYKDPMTGEDFQLVLAGGIPGEDGAGQPQAANPLAGSGRGVQLTVGRQAGAGQQPTGPGQVGSMGRGGIVGVVSKSTQKSFRLYNGRDTYNQWVFLGVQQSTRAGGPAGAAGPGRGVQGRPGGPGTGAPGTGGVGGTGAPVPSPRGAQPQPGRGGQPAQPGQRGFGGRGF